MLKKVRKNWITDILERSLFQEALILLGLSERPDAVMRPIYQLVRRSDPGERPLPPGTQVVDVFDDMDQALLILGQPGSEKTTLLLELARALLERATQDATHPIPVVFPLSTWAESRRPLVEWLVDELNKRYDVPLKLARAWVEADQILLLLDGLDEVKQEHRADCVETINAFRKVLALGRDLRREFRGPPIMIGHARRQLMRLIKSDPSWVEPLRRGEVDLEPVGMATLAIALTAAYGLAMAAFAAAKAQEAWATQLLASALKVPVLTILTFAATYPAFVLANRLGGLQLRPRAVLRLCLATFAVYAASLGALAPAIVLCSVVCNYSFTILINVAFFAASGLAAAAYLLRWVGDLSQAPDAARSPVVGPGGRPLRPRVAFAAWVVVFGLVGSQLGWMMRPLVGWRTLPFSWFRTDGMTLWEGIGSEIQNIWYSGGV